MKKLSVLLFVLLFLGFSSCEEKVDIEKEKKAIMTVIQNESEFARDGKYEELISLYVQDEYNTRFIYNQDSVSIVTGWKKLGPLFERYKRDTEEDYSWVNISKENPVIKVMCKTAWVICDNIWKGSKNGEEVVYESIQVSFLEKIDGEWKFSCATWVVKPQPEEEDDEDADEEEE